MMEREAMKERPILMSGPMVRAILDGRKTQTRRIVSPQPGPEASIDTFEDRFACNGLMGDIPSVFRKPFYCPYGIPGDRLWVREAWAPVSTFDPSPETGALYRADTHTGLEKRDGDQKWKSSIYMPRWASRITLDVIGIRVERLQDISSEDAIAEGVQCSCGRKLSYCYKCGNTLFQMYQRLWESINGPDSWDTNPWVWVIEFPKQGK